MRGEFYVRNSVFVPLDLTAAATSRPASRLCRALSRIPESRFKYWVANRMNERAASERDAAS